MLNIKRINELYHKSKTPEGLTEEEKKEQEILRREYIDSVKASFTSQLGDREEWLKARREWKEKNGKQ
ncbi:MAG: DUF896 domain-containing protein [Clostridia bacterium]|nr:DUF896 domain-containing protein [Clostridia bacterium]